MKSFASRSGLTLIELMVAMVAGLVVMGAALNAFFSMQSTSQAIDQKAGMGVNGRGAIYLIEENIRLMGFNPEGSMAPGKIVKKARAGLLEFKRNKDLEKPSEAKNCAIGLRKSDDPDRDGVSDSGESRLLVDSVPAADHIVALRFAYAFDDNEDGAIDVSDDGHVRWAVDSDGDGMLDTEFEAGEYGSIKTEGSADMKSRVGIGKIRAVKVWLLVRSQHPLKGSAKEASFDIGGKEYVPDYNEYKHELFTTTIRCRNMP